MKIIKGTLLEVKHDRKGIFKAVATKDFDTEKETFYPLALCEDVEGLAGKWKEGASIPCRGEFCTIKEVSQ